MSNPVPAGAAGISGRAGSSGAGAAGSGGAPDGSAGSGGSAGGSGGSDAGAGGTPDAAGGSAGSPASCASDDECRAAGLVCDPLPKRCVECLFDRDCSAGERCADRQCRGVVRCTNSLDCANAPFGETICDTSQGRCVACVGNPDCQAGHECIGNACVAVTSCINSLDCPMGKVCDTGARQCVECVADADCGTGKKCANRRCRSACASDTTCTPEGLLCDRAAGHCTRCLSHTDCPQEYHCAAGECLLDVCVADSSMCSSGNSIARCTPVGDRWVTTPCASRQTCTSSGATAECTNWVCTAGQTECDVTNKKVITCSADGLSIVNSVDCAATAKICYLAQCQSLACPPSTRFCENNAVKQCSSNGLSSTTIQTCTTGQFCDDATTSCRTQICAPNTAGCDGTRATTCNTLGSGWLGGGTDCATIPGQQCVSGACVCLSGRANCDGNAANGCEENLSTSAAHCGGCGASCSSSNVTPLCQSGNCTGACASGFDDCDANKRTNGCEKNLNTDTQNCGACARICSTSNMATVTCGTGTCNGNCSAGYTDCDSNKQTNGCERNTSGDPSYCGGCTQSCSSNNMATRTCSSGVCDGTCVSGYADCDTNKLSNGCEINTKTNPLHCNGCGRPCNTGEVCVNSVCQTCNNQVLLLGDGVAAANTRLETELNAGGLVTTVVASGVSTYAGTPAATDFGAVLIVGGNLLSSEMALAGQTAVISANSAGTGVLFTEFAAYKVYSYGYWTNLRSLLLVTATSLSSQLTTSYSLASGVTSHPIWEGLPNPFTTTVTQYHLRGPLAAGATKIADCSQCTGTGFSGAGVAVKDPASGGRTVQIDHSASYASAAWYNDANLLRMFVNAAKWATRCN
jgi:hypothetical protein